nr:RNA-directed DNA polymerase, eukaryota [Tanacetum cinerariifolium]
MAECFGCVANKFPFTYLGVKIGDNMARINSWQEVILKVSSKLSKWKAKTLSVGGKLTLIKSVLGAIPTYFMSLYKVPEAVLKHIERLRNSFFFVVELEERKISCTGGSVWVAIRKSIDTLNSKGVDLMQYCNKVIGNGSSTSFWHERWNGDTCFKERFHRLFNLELEKDISVAQKLDLSRFSSSFRKRLRGGLEESQWNEMAQMLVSSARKDIDKHLLDKLSTRSNLSYRGVDVPCVFCPVCDSKVESRNHFFGCSLVSKIYRLIGRWWSIHIPLFSDFASCEAWFKDLRITSLHKSVLEATFFSLWWRVWSFRNASVFAVVKPKKCMFFNNNVSQTFMWMNHRSRKDDELTIWMFASSSLFINDPSLSC